MTVHDAGVKLTEFDIWVKKLDGLCRPSRVAAVRKEHRPKSGGFPKRKDEDSIQRWSGANLLPCGNDLPNRRGDEGAFISPVHGEGIGG